MLIQSGITNTEILIGIIEALRLILSKVNDSIYSTSCVRNSIEPVIKLSNK